jgi:hypothetical protein
MLMTEAEYKDLFFAYKRDEISFIPTGAEVTSNFFKKNRISKNRL